MTSEEYHGTNANKNNEFRIQLESGEGKLFYIDFDSCLSCNEMDDCDDDCTSFGENCVYDGFCYGKV